MMNLNSYCQRYAVILTIFLSIYIHLSHEDVTVKPTAPGGDLLRKTTGPKVDYCSTQPCLMNGLCINRADKYQCVCTPRYSGNNCEQDNGSPCDPSRNPCQNNGRCEEDDTGNYQCVCDALHTGSLCETPLSNRSCDHSPCVNNGTCRPLPTEQLYECLCPPPYKGIHCEINGNEMRAGLCVDGSDDPNCLPSNMMDVCAKVVCPEGQICVPSPTSAAGGGPDHECRCPDGLAGDNCSVVSCASKPCHNNGTCVQTSAGNNFTCNCLSGYTGLLCESDIDECATKNICNFGICVNQNGTYQCFCQPGFAGDHCDVDFDECLSNPCFNGATCQNKINGYTCVCAPGYRGKECSININECESSPCLNGATCIDEVATFSCVCPKGLTGRLCEINIDDCESMPCLNGGVCIDLLNNYTCNCQQTGFTGVHCEINIDDCASNPCTNGARCVDKVKHYVCECYAGYTGKNCEDNIRECDSNPCQFGGTCLEHSNISLYHRTDLALPKFFNQDFNYSTAEGYECVCVPGIMGNNCEININECESSPCRWGACVDKIGGYVCECEDGIEGVHCEVDIDECDRYNPCKHGSCVDKRADWYCDCPALLYGGKNCSVELIGCAGSDTCLNGGTCRPYLIGETEHKFNCTCPSGFHGKICEKITTMSFNGASHIMLNTSRDEGYDISFRFKTTLPSGLLAIGKGSTYYILELVNGRLNLHSSLLNKWEGVFIGSKLNDSEWQKLFVAINSSHLVLAANEEQTIYPINPINQFDAPTTNQTSFNTTYVGGAISSLFHLAHVGSSFVGCIENVVINGEWVLPEEQDTPGSLYHNITVGCPREDQCSPNPCNSGGHCTDLWRDFSCSCERPFLGHRCQYNFTAATFGHENISNSLVSVSVGSVARRAVRNIVDISMFTRTRQQRGAIFYLGSEESYIAAEMEAGELFVRLQFNSTPESYNVGGIKLADGHNHLIQVVRNVTLVQVKLNGTEYFRKTISSTGILDVQVLYLGGIPESVHHHRSIRSSHPYTIREEEEEARYDFPHQYEHYHTLATPTSTMGRYARQTTEKMLGPLPNFKGIIHDVQISNGSRTMVVEFFPLQVEDVVIPPSFGNVTFDPATIIEGVVSDNACASTPCEYGGTCTVTWNDFNCKCTRGHKGKTCHEKEFCQLKDCPAQSECRNLNDGYECVSKRTFQGDDQAALEYSLVLPTASSSSSMGGGETEIGGGEDHGVVTDVLLDSILIMYRSRQGGTLLYVEMVDQPRIHFSISVHKQYIYVSWQLTATDHLQVRKIRKDEPLDDWTTLSFLIKDNALQGGVAEITEDPDKLIYASNFTYQAWAELVANGRIYLGGSDANHATFETASYVTDNEAEGGNSLEVTIADINTNEESELIGGGNFKGCLGEVRLGEYLLPFFTREQLSSADVLFSLKSTPDVAQMKHLGCVLCVDSECHNGARCLEPMKSYACNCTKGYTQEDCSVDIDECENHKCQNGATCVDQVAQYACKCLQGWEGALCEKEINECASNPCQNGGQCLDRVGYFECNCTEEYSGVYCETLRQISCANEPCYFGATCVDVNNYVTGDNFTCTCAHGFEGVRCGTPYCNVSPFCLHDGFCNISGPGGPACECSPGYTGYRCETNINECESSPCRNQAVCVDDVDRFICNCSTTGYMGITCEEDIDECEEAEMCGPHGECVNEQGGYRCHCADDMCGYQCAFSDPCKDNPCQNGGTCREVCRETPEYKCDCLSGWIGKNCTETPEFMSNRVADIALIVGPIIAIILIATGISVTVFFMMARKKRATRGTYSPSSQEYCNPRVEMDNVLKPPPEERLI